MKRALDYLIIPDCGRKIKKMRKAWAREELKTRIIKEILIVKGADSEEDILYLGKILKSGDRIGIDTFPLHFKEYKELIRKAKRDGKFPTRIKIENIETDQPLKIEIYGLLGLAEEKIKDRELEYKKNRREKFLEWIKRLVKPTLS